MRKLKLIQRIALLSVFLATMSIANAQEVKKAFNNLETNPEKELFREANKKLFKSFTNLNNVPKSETTNGAKGVILSEGFETAVPPAGWVHFQSVGTNSWTQNITNFNGGAASAWFDDFNGDNTVWLISPSVDLDSYTNEVFSYYEDVSFSAWANSHYVLYSNDYSGAGDPSTATWYIVNDAIGADATWVQQSFDISGLSGTTYFAFVYIGNFASEWYIDDFEITGDAIVLGDNTITAGGTAEPATIPSTTDTQAESFINFDFTITDDDGNAGADALNTLISGIKIQQGTGNDIADWTEAIEGAELSDGTNTATGTINGTNIDFSSLGFAAGEIGYIADNGNKTYTLKVWLKSTLGGTLPSTIDGLNFVFEVTNSSVTTDAASSGFKAGESENSGATNNEVTVTATQLMFTGQPASTATSGVALTTQPIVSATDENSNIDLDVSSLVTLANTGTLTMAGNSMNFVNGVADFGTPNTFMFTTGGEYVMLTATAPGLSTIAPSIEIAVDITGCVIFTEDFEGYANTSDLNQDGADWDFIDMPGNAANAVNDWGIGTSGSKRLTIYRGANAFEYRNNRGADEIAYYTQPIDGTNYKNIYMEFDWQGDGDPGSDYGTIVWSTDGVNWANAVATQFDSQGAFTSATVDLSVCDGQQFYIGFRWINDTNGNTNPPFAVDNIVISGFPKFDYNFSYRQDTYSPITGTVVTPDANEGANITLPAGFDFQYDGVPVTAVRANVNGWLEMGTTYIADAAPANELASIANVPFLAPLWDDLTTDAQSLIIYNVSGTAPTRVFTIEWRDMLWGGERQDFQVQLFESSYVIEFWYGTMNTNAGGSASIGINNVGGCMNKMISVTPGQTPIPSYTAELSSINSTTYLNSGLVYIFNPLVMQTYVSWQAADIVIGQADFATSSTTVNQTTGVGSNCAAVSSKGVVAVGSQGMDTWTALGRVMIYNSMPTANGQAADVVIGKDNFTDDVVGCTQTRMFAVDGVAFTPDGNKLIVSDSPNNRVLIWNTIPTVNGQPADVVIGQTDFTSSGSGTAADKFNYPTNLLVAPDGKLVVSDFRNNRVLIFNSVPTSNGASADVVIGQTNFTSNAASCSSTTMNGPWGNSYSPDGYLFISDSQNSRVLVYYDVPETNGASADLVLGQPDFTSNGTGQGKNQLNVTVGVTVSPEGKIAIGEFLNHRLIVFNRLPKSNGADADLVLGQPNFEENWEYNDGLSQADQTTPSDKNMKNVYGINFDLNGRLLVNGRDMQRAMLYGETPTETADLAVSISANETNVCIFADVEYTVNVTNNGGDPASNVVVNAQLPVGFNFNNYDASLGSYNQKSGYWTIPYIAVGETITLTFEGEVQPYLSGNNNVVAYANILASKQADSDFSNNGDNQIISVNTFYAPTSTDIADQYVNRNSHTIPAISFTVDDLDGLGDITGYTCTSSDETVIPLNYVTNLQFAGAEPNKTLDIYPETDAYGYVDMSVVLHDSHGCYKEYDFRIAVGNIWRGVGSGMFPGRETDWQTKDNWTSGKIPSTTIEAIIPTSPEGGYFPIIDELGDICEDLIIEPRASVTVNNTYGLQVFGDAIIESDATGTGSIVDLNPNGGNIITNRNVTVQRHITPDAWHYLSSPLTGVSNQVLTEDNCGTYNGNVLDYNEAFSGDNDGDGDMDWFDGWEWPWYYTPNSNALTPGNGYAYYSFSGVCTDVVEFTTTGATCLTSGDITYTVTNQDENWKPTGFGNHRGWNLIGNPYPSGINAEEFIAENCGVGKPLDGTIYLWDEDGFTGFNLEGSDYAAFNLLGSTNTGTGSGTVLPDKYISNGQAFFVHRTNTDVAGSTITFKNSMREKENSSFFKGTEQEVAKIKLSIKNDQNMYNEILVALVEDATDGRDPLYDGLKMEGNPHLAFYSKIDEDGFSIQAIPTLQGGEYKTVQLGLNAGYAGEYTIQKSLIQNIPQEISVWLEDLYEGEMINLRKEHSYIFNVDVEGRYEDRFVLHFNANNAPQVVNLIDNKEVLEDMPSNISIGANHFEDQDLGDNLTYDVKMTSGEMLPEWITFYDDNMSLYVQAENQHVGNYDLTITATDNAQAKASIDFKLDVINTNDAPVYNNTLQAQSVNVDEYFELQLPEATFTDVDANDILSLNAESLPNWLFFNAEKGILSGTPNKEDIGKTEIALVATDLYGATATAKMTVKVTSTTQIDELAEMFEVYPNPTSGKFYINSGVANYTLTITDALGRKIMQTEVNSENQTIDLTNQEAGVYNISIQLEDGSVVNKTLILN